MTEIKLQLPLKDIMVNQPFGVNYWNFYTNLGLKGHNGVDFEAKTGCKVHAAHDGLVIFSGLEMGGGGYCVEIIKNSSGDNYKTIYYHLTDKIVVHLWTKVQAGQLIGYADNTGKFTTGDHLHFGLKRTKDGHTVDTNNGYFGAIDPAPYFPKNWDKTPAYKRYGRERTWAFYQLEIKKAAELIRGLKRLPTHEEINAVTYGYWDLAALKNPAMAYNWKYLTKPGFEQGEKPFK